MSGTSPQQTLFERVGGKDAVRKLVHDFYRRVMEDATLRPFFEYAPMDRLRTMQYEFFAAALDGPSEYKGKQLSYVHFGRGITKLHFARFMDRLLDTLKDLNLGDDTTHAIIARLNTYTDEITGLTSDAG